MSLEHIWDCLKTVPDPEIPVISIVDLGIVREVQWRDEQLVVSVTPTYSGCPATEVISEDIRRALHKLGVRNLSIKMQLSPPWTTDWMSEEARRNLRNYGITPPAEQAINASQILKNNSYTAPRVECARCGTADTEVISEFGSTPCKALYRCRQCKETFDYFKCH